MVLLSAQPFYIKKAVERMRFIWWGPDKRILKVFLLYLPNGRSACLGISMVSYLQGVTTNMRAALMFGIALGNVG